MMGTGGYDFGGGEFSGHHILHGIFAGKTPHAKWIMRPRFILEYCDQSDFWG